SQPTPMRPWPMQHLCFCLDPDAVARLSTGKSCAQSPPKYSGRSMRPTRSSPMKSSS
ncbi:hypothetical protein L917_04652, partial [Phytophthora nicotianae]